jgi:hypothetical protein
MKIGHKDILGGLGRIYDGAAPGRSHPRAQALQGTAAPPVIIGPRTVPMADLLKGPEYPCFDLPGDFGQFMGKIEIKPQGSVLWALLAEKGAGKTHLCFHAMGIACKKYRHLMVSLEEHPHSNLFRDKIKHYIPKQYLRNCHAVGQEDIESMGRDNAWDTFNKLCSHYDIIFVDSWKVLTQDYGDQFSLRKWRAMHNGKLLAPIIHLNQDKTAKGGSNTEQDADIVLRILKFPNWKRNFLYWSKNRYQSEPDLRYSVPQSRLLVAKDFEDYTDVEQKLIGRNMVV